VGQRPGRLDDDDDDDDDDDNDTRLLSQKYITCLLGANDN